MMHGIFLPEKIVLTRGKGEHKEKLVSFEMALRDAGIAHLNIVSVSSIKPPKAEISRDRALLEAIEGGSVVPCVLARQDTNTRGTILSAAIGLAWPINQGPEGSGRWGYLSEHHALGQTQKEAGDYAEDLAAQMLATTLGIDFDPETSWDERQRVFKAGPRKAHVFDSAAVSQSMRCTGKWATVLAAAVLL